jgi:hypothetical protein
VIVLLFGLDRGFLMDVGPTRAEDFGSAAHVKTTDARKVAALVLPSDADLLLR